MDRAKARGWRFTYMAREANHGVFGRGSRMLPLLSIAILSGIFTSSVAALEGIALENNLAELEELGRNVVIFESSDPAVPATIERSSCEELVKQDSVIQAGVIQTMGRRPVLPLGMSIRVVAASGTLIPGLDRSSAVIGAELAPDSAPLQLLMDSTTVSARPLKRQPAGIDVNSTVIVPLNPTATSANNCIVRFSRFVDSAVASQLAQAQLISTGPPLIARMVLSNPSDPVRSFMTRPTRGLPLLLGLLGGVLIAVVLRLRVSELAAYYLSGTRGTQVATIVTLESLLIGGASALAGVITALAVNAYLIDLGSALAAALVEGVLWLIGAAVSIMYLGSRNPSDLAKDR